MNTNFDDVIRAFVLDACSKARTRKYVTHVASCESHVVKVPQIVGDEMCDFDTCKIAAEASAIITCAHDPVGRMFTVKRATMAELLDAIAEFAMREGIT